MTLLIRQLQLQDYAQTWQQMQDFTHQRDKNTTDEIWLVEHPPVFTLGQQGKKEHLLNASDIPVIQTDRGGQITYHGPGQLVAYPLIDIRRKKMGIRDLVTALEQTMIQLLADYQIQAQARPDAPGVYVDNAKIGSLGLRVRKGCCYHGLALNVAMDLAPFKQINPCGIKNLNMTQVKDLGGPESIEAITPSLITHICQCLGYNDDFILVDGRNS